MYRVVVKNSTDRAITLCETVRIVPGKGAVIAATPDIEVADRLVAVAGVGALFDFAAEERPQFVVVATEFGCVLDHPEHGRIEVTIFDPEAGTIAAAAPRRGRACRAGTQTRRHVRARRRALSLASAKSGLAR